MQAIEQHIEKLWKLNECDLGDMSDVRECMNALNIQYGVRFKEVSDLNEDDASFCTDFFNSDVEDCFCDKINTRNISFSDFNKLCLLFMDFSKMYKPDYGQGVAAPKPSKLFQTIANIVRQENETRFGYVVKEKTA